MAEGTSFQEVLKSVASLFAALQMTLFYNESVTINPAKPTFDYVIVGGGTAGCILANRLTEDPMVTVAIIETGDLQPDESMKPGYFTQLTGSKYDYNFYTEEDSYSAQELQGKSVRIPAGKMLSGTSGIHYMYHTRSNPRDLHRWVQASKNTSWSYSEMMKYYLKSERLEDALLLKTSDAEFHGTDGPIGLTRQTYKANWKIITSFQEIGYRRVLDLNGNTILEITEPLFQIFNGVRQSTAKSYLHPIKDRPNLYIFTLTTATKVLFNRCTKVVIGVEVVNCMNETLRIYAKKEVLLAAGVMKTAQLLLLSGIGTRKDIESWGINVLSDLPVGKAVRDQVGTVIGYKLNPQRRRQPPFNPEEFPIPVTIGLKSLNSRYKHPEYKVVNTLFLRNSTFLQPFCSKDLKFIDHVCKRFTDANKEKDLLLSSIYHLYPVSTGKIYLRNKNPLSDPWIYMGTFLESDDLEKLTSYVREFAAIENTRYFKKLKAEMVELNFESYNQAEKHSWEYWKAYARSMSIVMRHPVGSAPMGTVLDAELRVIGVEGLRVVDAAAIPTPGSGGRITDVIALAERAADLVKAART